MVNISNFRKNIFKFTLGKYDALEGFLASYFALISTYLILFKNEHFQIESINVLLYCVLQFSFIGTIVLLVLLITNRTNKYLDVTQFFAIILIPYINLLFIYKIATNYQYGDFQPLNYFYFILLLILFVKSISIFFYYIIFYYEMFIKKISSHSNSFFNSKYLKNIGTSTQKEKNIISISVLFIFGNYLYFNNPNPFLAPAQTFIILFAVFEVWSVIKNITYKISNNKKS